MVERIKRAMELARKERQSAVRSASEDGAVVAAEPAATTVADTPPQRIDTQPAPEAGRTITVAEATLRESHLLLPGMVGEVAHSFRLLRTQVLQRMRQRCWNTLAILSAGPDEGKTFTAINLAIAIAADRDATALLVDLDLRFPRIYRRFGFVPTVGVEDCLHGEASLAEAMLAVEGYTGLALLPARGPVEHSSELISSASARALFREIKERYPNRTIIYDLPPVLATDDALSFLPQVDAALLVVGEARTQRQDLLRCLELLRDTPILGTVLNGSKRERSAEYAY